MSDEIIGKIVNVKCDAGLDLRLIEAVFIEPAYVLLDLLGERLTVSVSACEGATPAQELEYWKARALVAEQRNTPVGRYLGSAVGLGLGVKAPKCFGGGGVFGGGATLGEMTRDAQS